jgi:hypothetical protein
MDPCDKSDHFAEELFAAYKRPGPPQLHYFEVWSSPIGELCTRTGTVDVSQLGHWLSLNEGYEILTDDEKPVKESNVILRLVGCDFWGEQSGFEMIREAFELHETSEEAIKNKNGAYGRYLTRGKGSAEIDTFSMLIFCTCLSYTT